MLGQALKCQVREACFVAAGLYKAANITQGHQNRLAALCILLSSVLINFQLALQHCIKHNTLKTHTP